MDEYVFFNAINLKKSLCKPDLHTDQRDCWFPVSFCPEKKKCKPERRCSQTVKAFYHLCAFLNFNFAQMNRTKHGRHGAQVGLMFEIVESTFNLLHLPPLLPPLGNVSRHCSHVVFVKCVIINLFGVVALI